MAVTLTVRDHPEPKTQKARSVLALSRDVNAGAYSTQVAQVVTKENPVVPPGRWFVRPCPRTPRHGFVPSRTLILPDEADILQSLWDHCQALDPDAELVLMPFIPALYSAVITPTGVSVGLWHTGATGGKGVYLPTPTSKHYGINGYYYKMYNQAGLTLDSTPYLEVVLTAERMEVVQVRSGPPVPALPYYIPSTYGGKMPTTVIHASSLRARDYESLDDYVRDNPTEDYTVTAVVGHPNSMASHLCAQAIMRRWAYIPTGSLGDSFDPLNRVPLWPFPTTGGTNLVMDYPGLRRALQDRLTLGSGLPSCGSGPEQVATSAVTTSLSEECTVAVACLHALPCWSITGGLVPIAARAITTLFRLYGIALVGESRHGRYRCVDNLTTTTPRPRVPRKLSNDRVIRVPKKVRDCIFAAALDESVVTLSKQANTLRDWFHTAFFKGGFGGDGWQRASIAYVHGLQALRFFLDTPTQECWGALVTRAHDMLTIAHNNGPILDKFIEKTDLDTASRDPLVLLTKAPSIRIIAETRSIDQRRKRIKGGIFDGY